jgi:hypothetical protein
MRPQHGADAPIPARAAAFPVTIDKTAWLAFIPLLILVGSWKSHRKAQIQREINPETEGQNSHDRHEEALEAALRHTEIYKDSRHHKAKRYWDKWENRVGAATLLFVAIYTCQSFLGWYTARDTEQRSLRAYLTIATGEDETGRPRVRLDVENGVLNATINVRNDGQTPAYTYQMQMSVEELPFPLSGGFTYPTQRTYTLPSVGPHAIETETLHGWSINWLSHLREYSNRKLAVYVYGSVVYDDAFSGHHWFNYCIFYLPPVPSSNYCDAHNDSDDSQRAAHDAPPAP